MAESSEELFPPSQRAVYEKTPTIEVICQLRFPSLLTIESSPPAGFQERIRSMFPILERPANSPLPEGLPQEIAQVVSARSGSDSYQFLTEDRSSFVTLTPGSLALTSNEYSRWEDFRGQLRAPLKALIEIYEPSFFSRVGLRYQDVIDRTKIGLPTVPWSALLKREILGELALPQFEANVEKVAHREIRIRIPDGSGSVMMRHGLADVRDREGACYVIDIDIFCEQKTEVQDAESTLNSFNELAGRAFRWCITDTLRDALGPSDLAVATA